MARYFDDEVVAAVAGKRPPPSWRAVVLQWVRADLGVARVLLEGLAVETTVRLVRPARLGDVVMLAVGATGDVGRGGPSFVDVSTGVEDDDEEEAEEEAGCGGSEEEE